ncbi:hypothetical protein R5R35_013361 [Gryllus longicercus]|uniref:Putative nuclease HARBI1 n=1 Tax=Gryllus longicercus TaxID=2509291 RepID=A0AAN9WG92_9ORTH
METFVRFRHQKVYRERRMTEERSYKTLYRFHAENVQWLANYFLGEYNETRGGAVNNETKMRIFLRYLADPGFQIRVAEDIGVDQSTISKTFSYVLNRIVEKRNEWVKFPTTAMALDSAKMEWKERYSFPAAIGAVDCTHILIRRPHMHGDEYVNRKGHHSLNVQATCNSKEEFTSIDVSWPGSVHDARIWRNSNMCRVMTNQANALLIGDSGYPIAPWLMTPYQNPTTPEQTAFNRVFKTERVVIERCFGQLKRRFPILQSRIRLSTEKVPSVILCCCILHNIAKYLQDEDFPEPGDQEDEDELIHDGVNEQNIRQRGQQRRNEIAQIIHGMRRV